MHMHITFIIISSFVDRCILSVHIIRTVTILFDRNMPLIILSILDNWLLFYKFIHHITSGWSFFFIINLRNHKYWKKFGERIVTKCIRDLGPMETKEGPNGTLEIRIENHISISDLFKNYFRENKKDLLLVAV